MTTESMCSYHIKRAIGARHSCVLTHTPIINYALKSEVAFLCSYAQLVAQHYKWRYNNFFAKLLWKCREAILHYHKLTPCIVSENNWNTKEDKGAYIHDTCIVHTAVGEKTHFSRKRHQAEKNKNIWLKTLVSELAI